MHTVSESLGLANRPGDAHYRAFVGPPADYDLVAAMSFGLLTTLGMRQHHRVLDIGCGSLRIGRLLIPYLNCGGYTGLEPNAWLIDEGIAREVGRDQVSIKQPRFIHAASAAQLIDNVDSFDFILAQSIFSHCGSDLLDQLLGECTSLLSAQGTLIATYLENDVDTTELGWVYPGCVSYSTATLARAAQSHGLEFVPLDWRHPRQRWALFAKPGFGAGWFDGRELSWNTSFDHYLARRQNPGK